MQVNADTLVFGPEFSHSRDMTTPKPTSGLPPEHTIYAIGDIHGRIDLLVRLMKLIKTDAVQNPQKTKTLVFLGDYVDRGVDTKGVIEYLINNLPANMEKVFLRGNHDDAMLRFLKGETEHAQDWLMLGGTATLVSYGVNPFRTSIMKDLKQLRKAVLERVPESHRRFLEETVIDYACGDYYFVHAGVRPGVPLDRQTEKDRMWIRHDFLGSSADFGKTVVHGHSILPEPDVQPNRIGIDTGAYATGTLTCLVLQDKTHRFLAT